MRSNRQDTTGKRRMHRTMAAVGTVAVVLALAACDTTTDTDGDLIPNLYENLYGWDPADPDTNDNGTLDGLEDPDDDGLTTTFEVVTYPTGAGAGLGLNPTDADSDDDLLPDGDEVNLYDFNPLDADMDDDGLDDGRELSYGADPLDADSDEDGLPTGDEAESTAPTPCRRHRLRRSLRR